MRFARRPRASRDPLADIPHPHRELLQHAAHSLVVLTAGRYRPMGRPSFSCSPQLVGVLVEKGLLARVDCNSVAITPRGQRAAKEIERRAAWRTSYERGRI